METDPRSSGVVVAPEQPAATRSVPDPRNASPAHRWGIGAFLLVQLVYLVASAAFMPFVAGGPLSFWLIAFALAVPTVLAAGLAVLITKLRGNGPCIDFRLTWSWRQVGLGLLFGLGGLVISAPAAMLYRAMTGPEGNAAAVQVFGLVHTAWPWAVAAFVLVAVVGPFCEEIVYRGLLWGAIDRRWGRWVAFGVTTVVFAFAHFELTRFPLLLVLAIPIGLARLYSGGLLASIVAHQVTNVLPGVVVMLSLVGAVSPA